MSKPARPVLWVDVLKGLGIVLVVVGHVIGGLTASGIVDVGSRADAVREYIYCFHMPVFFLAAGLFVRRSFARGGRRFFVDKIATVAYPYVVWSIAFFLMQLAFGKYTNTRPSSDTLLRMWYEPPSGGTWFLYVLFLAMLLFAAVESMQKSNAAHLVIAAVLWCVGVAGLLPAWSPLRQLAAYYPYFVLGVVLSESLMRCAESTHPTLLLVGAAIGLLIPAFGLLVPVVGIVYDLTSTQWMSLVIGIAGVVGLIALAMAVARNKYLALLGRHSLGIYLLHPYPSVFARVLLQRGLAIDDSVIHIIVGSVMGVALPLAASLLIAKYELPFVFALPSLMRMTVRDRALVAEGRGQDVAGEHFAGRAFTADDAVG